MSKLGGSSCVFVDYEFVIPVRDKRPILVSQPQEGKTWLVSVFVLVVSVPVKHQDYNLYTPKYDTSTCFTTVFNAL